MDATGTVRSVRRLKSPAEIAVIEQAQAAGDAGLLALQAGVRPGMTELEAWNLFMSGQIAAGGEPAAIHETVAVGPPEPMLHTMSSRRRIQPGDFFHADVCGAVDRYHARACRTYFMGSPPAELTAITRILAGAFDVLAETARVGTPFDEVTARLAEYYRDAGAPEGESFMGGYELGIAFPPDWVGEFCWGTGSDHAGAVVEAGLVTNVESCYFLAMVDTVVLRGVRSAPAVRRATGDPDLRLRAGRPRPCDCGRPSVQWMSMASRPPQLLTIGQFSALTDISRPSLRRYDEAGLLRPILVDDTTGYRYYSSAQLDVAETIRLLRDLQVPLADIQELLASDDAEGLERLLTAHKRRIAEQVERGAQILARVDEVLSQGLPLIPQSHEVRVIELPETPVVSCRGQSPPSLDALVAAREACAGRLDERIAAEHLTAAGPVVYLHELDEFAPWYSPARFQACLPLAPGSALPADAWTLPACTAASTVHTGPWDGLRASWAALVAWVGRSAYDASPPVRVTYEVGPGGPADPAGYVTHIALPIRPV